MLNDKVAIVTGGLQGMGLSIAKELTRQGARVAVGSRRGDDPESSINAIKAVGEHGMVMALDVQHSESVDNFVQHVRSSIGTPDIVINAAGISVHHIISGHSDVDWESVIDINLNGPFRVIRACIDDMKAKKWGRIVNIASTAAKTAAETHAAYCASKAGLVGMTRAVAIEGGPYGINCVAISPSWVETEMLRESAKIQAKKANRSMQEEIALMAKSNPQNRLIQSSEIAALTAFCCSDAAAGLTMEDIQINAGALW